MRTEDLASWFNIKYGSFRKNSGKYLDILKYYCDYEKVHGGVIINEIYISEYVKNMNVKDREKYLEEIKLCVKNQDGLSTLSGMSRKLLKEGYFTNEFTGRYRLAKVGKELFGETKELISHGTEGSREYVWAIKLNDYNIYRSLTEKEEKVFDKIITECYGAQPEKIKKMQLLEDQLRSKVIDSDEYFELKEKYGLNTFRDCLYKFQEETGYTIVRCTKHELMEYQNFE